MKQRFNIKADFKWLWNRVRSLLLFRNVSRVEEKHGILFLCSENKWNKIERTCSVFGSVFFLDRVVFFCGEVGIDSIGVSVSSFFRCRVVRSESVELAFSFFLLRPDWVEVLVTIWFSSGIRSGSGSAWICFFFLARSGVAWTVLMISIFCSMKISLLSIWWRVTISISSFKISSLSFSRSLIGEGFFFCRVDDPARAIRPGRFARCGTIADGGTTGKSRELMTKTGATDGVPTEKKFFHRIEQIVFVTVVFSTVRIDWIRHHWTRLMNRSAAQNWSELRSTSIVQWWKMLRRVVIRCRNSIFFKIFFSATRKTISVRLDESECFHVFNWRWQWTFFFVENLFPKKFLVEFLKKKCSANLKKNQSSFDLLNDFDSPNLWVWTMKFKRKLKNKWIWKQKLIELTRRKSEIVFFRWFLRSFSRW